MNAKKLLISFRNNKVWFIDVQDWGGGDFACLVADKSTSSIENKDELRMSTHTRKSTDSSLLFLLQFFRSSNNTNTMQELGMSRTENPWILLLLLLLLLLFFTCNNNKMQRA
jgi:hypothetical protein